MLLLHKARSEKERQTNILSAIADPYVDTFFQKMIKN